MGCEQEQQSYLLGTIEKFNEKNNIVLLVEENNSKIGETDKVILRNFKNFSNLKKGQKIKVWVNDEGVILSNPPQVFSGKIDVINYLEFK